MRKFAAFGVAASVLAVAIMFSTPAAQAKTGVWYGTVNHVSTQNIKVTNPKDHQTLSFLLVPKFQSIFGDDGNTTMQMSQIKSGDWVKVYYDQKLLGARHADKIIDMSHHVKMKT